MSECMNRMCTQYSGAKTHAVWAHLQMALNDVAVLELGSHTLAITVL